MSKIKDFFIKSFKLSILDITLAGIFIGVWLVVNRFLTLDFGIMQAGITYAIAIIVGLYFKPIVAVLVAIIADTISLAISQAGIGMWMWEYAIVYPLLVLFVGFMKWIFTTKKEKMWLIFSVVAFLVTILGAILVASLKDGFVHNSHNSENAFDFSQSWSKILIWTMIAVMAIAYITMILIYMKNRSKNLKVVIMVYTIVSLIIVLFIWVWGPYADIRYLQKKLETGTFDKLYEPALIVRVLKTPIILPLYTAIVYPLYKIVSTIKSHQKENKWS